MTTQIGPEPSPPAASHGARQLRIGIQIEPQHADYSDIRRAVATAEEMGVDVVFNWDHFFPLDGDMDGKHFECWTMLGAWAEATEQVEIGALVACNSYRNPDLLADMARTVDHIADSRLILGIGAGWNRRDYNEYGYEFGTAGTRLDSLAEAMPRIERRLSRLNPAPTRHIPVLVGGGGERKTLRITARHADIWHGFGDARTIAHKHEVLDAWCAEVDRDPAEIERSVEIEGGIHSPSAEGEALYAVGTRLFTIPVEGPSYDLAPVRDWLAWRNEKNAAEAAAAR
jgi:probable F420-dependent oxidoreductase